MLDAVRTSSSEAAKVQLIRAFAADAEQVTGEACLTASEV
jgi:hypothetical protein